MKLKMHTKCCSKESIDNLICLGIEMTQTYYNSDK